MPAFSARFMRVGTHMINIEAIQRVDLRKDDSALLALSGPRKSLQLIPVPSPFGRELWQFVHDNLLLVEFGEPVTANGGGSPPVPPDEPAPRKQRKKAKTKAKKAK